MRTLCPICHGDAIVLEHYVLEGDTSVLIGEYACMNLAVAKFREDDIRARYPQDRHEFVVREAA